MDKLKRLYQRSYILIWTILGIGGVFLFWYLLSLLAIRLGAPTLFPGPQIVIPIVFDMLGSKELWEAIGGTLLRLFIAMLIGVLFGFIFGIIGGLSKAFDAFIKPFVIVLRTIPTAAVIFILIALLEPKFAPIIIVFLITFPLLYESISTGFKNIPKAVKDAAKIDGANVFKATFRIYLPLSWSYILLGIVQSIGLGMKVSIMSEILSGGHYNTLPGIGHLLYIYSITIEADKILALSLIAIMIVGLIEIGLYFAKRKLKKTVTQ